MSLIQPFLCPHGESFMQITVTFQLSLIRSYISLGVSCGSDKNNCSDLMSNCETSECVFVFSVSNLSVCNVSHCVCVCVRLCLVCLQLHSYCVCASLSEFVCLVCLQFLSPSVSVQVSGLLNQQVFTNLLETGIRDYKELINF